MFENFELAAESFRARLAERQIRRTHLDRRVEELQRTLDRRIDLRAELESGLEPEGAR